MRRRTSPTGQLGGMCIIQVYTAILTPEGITLEDGSLVSIEKFSRLPCRRRAYFLKYAGADVSRTGEAAPSINSVNSRVSDVRSN